MRQPKQPEAEATDRSFSDRLRRELAERQRRVREAHGRLLTALGIDPHKKEDPE